MSAATYVDVSASPNGLDGGADISSVGTLSGVKGIGSVRASSPPRYKVENLKAVSPVPPVAAVTAVAPASDGAAAEDSGVFTTANGYREERSGGDGGGNVNYYQPKETTPYYEMNHRASYYSPHKEATVSAITSRFEHEIIHALWDTDLSIPYSQGPLCALLPAHGQDQGRRRHREGQQHQPEQGSICQQGKANERKRE